jgi:lipid II:glycine glycyltransferase (peptidoglycan interpeptide bridge formation enzyme)
VIHTVEVTSAREWDAAVSALPGASFMQAWEWGEFKARVGWRAMRWLWREEGHVRPLAAAQLLERSLRLGPLTLRVGYVPKGPLLQSIDASLLESALAALESHARARHAVQVKIDPDIPVASSASLGDEVTPHAFGQAVEALLHRRGWRFSPEQIQFRSTVVLDLTPPEEALLAAMKQKTRYNIRLAARKGVTVRQGTLGDLHALYHMYAATAHRDRFIIRDEEYYQAAWGAFIQADRAQAFIAEFEGQPIAAIIVFVFGGRASYVYGMSLDDHRERMPNHLLQWEAMCWARRRGCSVYDLWGAPDSPKPDDPLWGVYNFKQGFGGRHIEHVGAWDYAPNRTLYAAYTRVLPGVLSVMRVAARDRIRRTAQGE